jgi:uncharacterized protein YbjT (DUF2867 family)
MNIVVLGTSGKTGSLVVKELIKYHHSIKVVVRNNSSLTKELMNNENI